MSEEEQQEKMLQQQKEQEKAFQLEMQLNALARQVLEPEARERLNNVKLVNKEKYFRVLQQIIFMHQQGKITEKITGQQLKELLLMNQQEKKEFVIKRR